MTNDHKLDDSKGFDKNTDHVCELLQNKLNAFLEQENAAMVAVNKQQSTTELQDHLDQFIDKLQGDIDVLVEQNTAASTDVNVLNNGDKKSVSIEVNSGQLEEMPISAEQKRSDVELPVASNASNRTSYAKLIAIVLIGASCATAVVLWFVWPVEQMWFSQVEKQQQNSDVSQPMTVLPHTEIMADKVSVVQETEQLAIKKDVKGMMVMPEAKQAAVMTRPPIVNQSLIEKNDMPVAATGLAHALDDAGRKLTVAVNIGNIRSAPDSSGRVLYKLIRGAKVTKLDEQKGWFKVRLRNGTIAWAHHSIFQPD